MVRFVILTIAQIKPRINQLNKRCPMKISCHLQKRMSERHISYDVINLIMTLGNFSKNGERIILDNDTLKTAIKYTEKFKKHLIYLLAKKGGSLVLTDNTLVTSFLHYGEKNVKNKQRKNNKKHIGKHYCHSNPPSED